MSTPTQDPYTVANRLDGAGDRHRVVSASYHRNGVGGAGFYVGLVDTTDSDTSDTRRYLVTWFPAYDDEGQIKDRYQERVAVLLQSDVAASNIGMHPLVDPRDDEPLIGTGNAAWRGADNWQVVLPLLKQWVNDSHEAIQRHWQMERVLREREG